MRKEQLLKGGIVAYNDADDFDGSIEVKYPCNTQYMIYQPMLHRYELTVEGLEYYNIKYEQYVTDSSNNASELIRKTSKKVYDYIQYKAGISRYQIMMYRIATAPKTIYHDQYFMRKQFEEALADQARWLVKNGDSAEYSKVSITTDTGEVAPLKPDDALRDTSDMSQETIRTLETLGLTRWFAVQQGVQPGLDKY